MYKGAMTMSNRWQKYGWIGATFVGSAVFALGFSMFLEPNDMRAGGISGLAMVMAWLKLRRRNIAPLLNANGWAINAASKISIPFGETLTDSAKFPKLKLKDPYAKKGLAPWKKWVISISALAVVFGVLWIFNLLAWAKLPSPLPRYNKVEEVVEEVVVAADSTAVAVDSTAVAAQ